MASVFHPTDLLPPPAPAYDPSTLKVPENFVDATAHFAVYADRALGADGQRDARGVLSKCETDYAAVSSYFAGLTAGPFSVILFDFPGGAFHYGCAATDLFCSAKTAPPDGDFSEFLNVAEFVEVFEAVQAKGWDCSKSNGEGLSRVLATDAYPQQLAGFATAHKWLDSPRENFVDQTFPGDTNSVANGCAVLFLNWLRFQLNYSWEQIVSAAAPTLGQTYRNLTGKADGFTKFQVLIYAHFPPGQPSQLSTDNPFPL